MGPPGTAQRGARRGASPRGRRAGGQALAEERVRRWASCRSVRPERGSRQCGAMRAAGPSTKPRLRNSRCGTVSLSSAQHPPDHSTTSRSSVRERQRWPCRLRPNLLSKFCSRSRSSRGSSEVEITAAPFAYSRCDGPTGRLWMTGATTSIETPYLASSARAAPRIARGWPWRGWRWFDPSAIR